MVLNNAASICRGKLCDLRVMIVVINIGGPGEGRFEKPIVTNTIGSAESGNHHIVDCENGRLN